MYARALLKQKMADAADKTIRVCSSSGVVFAFIVGPEGNFLIEELGKWPNIQTFTGYHALHVYRYNYSEHHTIHHIQLYATH